MKREDGPVDVVVRAAQKKCFASSLQNSGRPLARFITHG
jgi:hypothetical protein